jgi:hypothetical protein
LVNDRHDLDRGALCTRNDKARHVDKADLRDTRLDILNSLRSALGRNNVNIQAFFLIEALVDCDIERRMPSESDEIQRERYIGQFFLLGLRLPRLACRPTKHEPGRAKERCNYFLHLKSPLELPSPPI